MFVITFRCVSTQRFFGGRFRFYFKKHSKKERGLKYDNTQGRGPVVLKSFQCGTLFAGLQRCPPGRHAKKLGCDPRATAFPKRDELDPLRLAYSASRAVSVGQRGHNAGYMWLHCFFCGEPWRTARAESRPLAPARPLFPSDSQLMYRPLLRPSAT